jgi:hypothetical protein
VETMATVVFGGPLSLTALQFWRRLGQQRLPFVATEHNIPGRALEVEILASRRAQMLMRNVVGWRCRISQRATDLPTWLRGCRRGCRRRRLPCRRCQRKDDPLQAEAVWLGVGCHLLAHALLAPWQPCTKVGHAWQLHVPPDTPTPSCACICSASRSQVVDESWLSFS